MTDSDLQEQIEYYRARAPEYDDWWLRRGRYDRGDAFRSAWVSEAQGVRAALRNVGPVGHALEFAPGTGIWTRELADFCIQITAVDASPEMVEVNRAKVGADNVSYQLADIFEWQPQRTYDLVFFGFWISHVPRERLDGFLSTVRRAMSEGGRVFFVDGQPDPGGGPVEHAAPDAHAVHQQRTLNDGREFRIIKIYYPPAELTEAFDHAGIDASIHLTDRFFMYGSGTVRR